MYSLKEIFKDTKYNSAIFTVEEISAIEEKIYTKKSRGKDYAYIKCQIRGKEIRLTPEEVVRQLYIYRLIHKYGYSTEQIAVEHAVRFGLEIKRADIVIFETIGSTSEYIIVEVKKPNLSDGKEQLRSYCYATNAKIGVWTNGYEISYYIRRQDPEHKDKILFEPFDDLPSAAQDLEDILKDPKTIEYLIQNDLLQSEGKTLSRLIREMEDEVLANSGEDVFEEVFKLIYTKLYDELQCTRDTKRRLEFRNYGGTDKKLKKRIESLFQKAKDKWSGVFKSDDEIELTPSHLAVCVSSLQNVKLFNSNLDVIDDAFEYLMNKTQKGEKGQYFTPRYVIDMCVKMLNPKSFETMIDTAAGSCGFPMHTTFYVWQSILKEKNLPISHLFTAEKKPLECEDYVNEKVFAIDFDKKAVRVARTLNLIAGDGRTNVLKLNTLDYGSWDEVMKEQRWLDDYNEGWKKLRALRRNKDENRDFNFDILMANPPFAGDVKESKIISKYTLGEKFRKQSDDEDKPDDVTYYSKVGRDILFIERNLQFLKDGGRMAIVLPQGRFNNSSDKYIRDFIAERCRILAVVGLHGNVFKPHTGTKTSVLFVQKWHKELCPYREDYPIFFATMQKPSKDNSGEKIFVTDKNSLDNCLHDKHGHRVVEHDLFNHEGLTQDGIAEAFIEFAKREKLSFFESGSFDEDKYKSLLEELEISEVNISEIDDKLFRLEAEYYSHKYLILEHQLKNFIELGQLSEKIECGPFGSNLLDTEYLSSGVLVVRPFNLKNLVVEDDNLVYISPDLVKKNKLKLYQKGTLLFSRVGDIKIGVLNRDTATISPNIVAVELKEERLAKFLAVFFNTYVGFTQIERQLKVSAQPTISTNIIEKLRVPFDDNLISKVVKKFDVAQEKLEQANRLYYEAEKILSDSLNLENFVPSDKNIAIKTLSNSFGVSGRLDAEYYQPKYEDYLKLIKNYSDGSTKVKHEFELIKKICDRKKDSYNYVEIGDVSVSTGVASYNNLPVEELPDNAKLMTCAGDLIVSKVRPNRGAVAILQDNNLLVSGAFTVLRASGNYLKETLQVLLRTKIYRDLMLRYNVGTSYPVIKDDDVLNLPLPVIDLETQAKISAQIKKSFALRRESEKLLESAKAAVEFAIEHGE